MNDCSSCGQAGCDLPSQSFDLELGAPPSFAPPGFGPAPPPCPDFPWEDVATNNRYLFLKEIGGANPASCLRIFLESVIASGSSGDHWGGTLILDDIVTIDAPLTVPPGFTLAGVGMYGTGGLLVPKALSGPALTLGANSVLRDLRVENADLLAAANKPVGIHVRQTGPVYIDSVRVFGMSAGILADGASSVIICNCSIDNNFRGIVLRGQSRHCRIRDSDIRTNRLLGVDLDAATDVVIQGCVIEGNGRFINLPPDQFTQGGIRVGMSFGALIFGNRFESNGLNGFTKAIAHVIKPTAPDPGGTAARFIGNLFSGDQFRPGELNDEDPFKLTDAIRPVAKRTQTHIGFNSSTDFSFLTEVEDRFPTAKVNAPTT